MIELFNKLFEKVLRKNHFDVNWNHRISTVVKFVNSRIIDYFEISLIDINFEVISKISIIISTLLDFSEREIKIWHDELVTSITHANHVKNYFQYKTKLHDIVRKITRRRREIETRRYNKNVKQIVHQIDSLIMLYQKISDKLQSRWRESFQIIDYENIHEFFFTLRQLVIGRDIRDIFHENHLKTFVSRIDYLFDILNQYESNQNIRRSRKRQRKI